MRTLFLSTSDMVGGAARATYWLAKGLRQIGSDVSMFVDRKSGDDYWISNTAGRAGKALDMARPILDVLPLCLYPKRKRSAWSVNVLPNPGLISRVSSFAPDIINLHWIGGGFLPITGIKSLPAPVVWSLYDMWPFTGGCHYDDFCNKFCESCGNCPQLSSAGRDISSWILHRKEKSWLSVPMTVVAPSAWLAGEARKSRLFSNCRVEVIPHGTDLNIFKPINKQLAREILGIPKQGLYLLFGSVAGTADRRKGFQYLIPALKRLAGMLDSNTVRLIVFGETEPENIPDFGFPIHFLGRLHDDVSLSVLYSAADITVTPSMQEAFGMTASESMACGTPAVAFGASGPLDVIDHKINGYLAVPYEVEDFMNGILWMLSDKRQLVELSINARKKCEAKYELSTVAKQYRSLYEELINGK